MVVTISLGWGVVDQIQYNLESAQYLCSKLSYNNK